MRIHSVSIKRYILTHFLQHTLTPVHALSSNIHSILTGNFVPNEIVYIKSNESFARVHKKSYKYPQTSKTAEYNLILLDLDDPVYSDHLKVVTIDFEDIRRVEGISKNHIYNFLLMITEDSEHGRILKSNAVKDLRKQEEKFMEMCTRDYLLSLGNGISSYLKNKYNLGGQMNKQTMKLHSKYKINKDANSVHSIDDTGISRVNKTTETDKFSDSRFLENIARHPQSNSINKHKYSYDGGLADVANLKNTYLGEKSSRDQINHTRPVDSYKDDQLKIKSESKQTVLYKSDKDRDFRSTCYRTHVDSPSLFESKSIRNSESSESMKDTSQRHTKHYLSEEYKDHIGSQRLEKNIFHKGPELTYKGNSLYFIDHPTRSDIRKIENLDEKTDRFLKTPNRKFLNEDICDEPNYIKNFHRTINPHNAKHHQKRTSNREKDCYRAKISQQDERFTRSKDFNEDNDNFHECISKSKMKNLDDRRLQEYSFEKDNTLEYIMKSRKFSNETDVDLQYDHKIYRKHPLKNSNDHFISVSDQKYSKIVGPTDSPVNNYLKNNSLRARESCEKISSKNFNAFHAAKISFDSHKTIEIDAENPESVRFSHKNHYREGNQKYRHLNATNRKVVLEEDYEGGNHKFAENSRDDFIGSNQEHDFEFEHILDNSIKKNFKDSDLHQTDKNEELHAQGKKRHFDDEYRRIHLSSDKRVDSGEIFYDKNSVNYLRHKKCDKSKQISHIRSEESSKRGIESLEKNLYTETKINTHHNRPFSQHQTKIPENNYQMDESKEASPNDTVHTKIKNLRERFTEKTPASDRRKRQIEDLGFDGANHLDSIDHHKYDQIFLKNSPNPQSTDHHISENEILVHSHQKRSPYNSHHLNNNTTCYQDKSHAKNRNSILNQNKRTNETFIEHNIKRLNSRPKTGNVDPFSEKNYQESVGRHSYYDKIHSNSKKLLCLKNAISEKPVSDQERTFKEFFGSIDSQKDHNTKQLSKDPILDMCGQLYARQSKLPIYPEKNRKINIEAEKMYHKNTTALFKPEKLPHVLNSQLPKKNLDSDQTGHFGSYTKSLASIGTLIEIPGLDNDDIFTIFYICGFLNHSSEYFEIEKIDFIDFCQELARSEPQFCIFSSLLVRFVKLILDDMHSAGFQQIEEYMAICSLDRSFDNLFNKTTEILLESDGSLSIISNQNKFIEHSKPTILDENRDPEFFMPYFDVDPLKHEVGSHTQSKNYKEVVNESDVKLENFGVSVNLSEHQNPEKHTNIPKNNKKFTLPLEDSLKTQGKSIFENAECRILNEKNNNVSEVTVPWHSDLQKNIIQICEKMLQENNLQSKRSSDVFQMEIHINKLLNEDVVPDLWIEFIERFFEIIENPFCLKLKVDVKKTFGSHFYPKIIQEKISVLKFFCVYLIQTKKYKNFIDNRIDKIKQNEKQKNALTKQLNRKNIELRNETETARIEIIKLEKMQKESEIHDIDVWLLENRLQMNVGRIYDCNVFLINRNIYIIADNCLYFVDYCMYDSLLRRARLSNSKETQVLINAVKVIQTARKKTISDI